jgi:hypothetical protein
MAKLTEAQIELVGTWTGEGANLNEVQQRLKSEFGITITYLEARMLLMDIGVRIKEKPKPEPLPEPVTPEPPPSADDWTSPSADAGTPTGGNLTVNVDPAALQGTIASGKATFSDGQIVVWYVDPNGRLGMKAPYAGYQPPAQDIPMFETELDRLLQAL